MLKVGVTGGAGTGKSTALNIFESLGIKTLSSDTIVRDLQKKGTEVYKNIVKTFGSAILSKNGEINRKKLSSIIFNNRALRKKLEKIVHPKVLSVLNKTIKKWSEMGTEVAVLELPLLFEAKIQNRFDRILLITSSKENQMRRLREKTKLDKRSLLKIIASQMPLGIKKKLSDDAISNNETKRELKVKIKDYIKKLKIEGLG